MERVTGRRADEAEAEAAEEEEEEEVEVESACVSRQRCL